LKDEQNSIPRSTRADSISSYNFDSATFMTDFTTPLCDARYNSKWE
jgi:hypothetical protein